MSEHAAVAGEEAGSSQLSMANVEVSDLRKIVSVFSGSGPAWTLASEDLNVNLIVLRHNAGIPEHVNEAVDVLLVGIEGEGVLTVDGRSIEFGAGSVALVPKGARRAVHATSLRLGYLTCHRRRGGLWPGAARSVRGEPETAEENVSG